MNFSKNLTRAQFLTARFDEVEIEARLHSMVLDPDSDERELSEHWAALHSIEQAKVEGTYESLRAKLRSIAAHDGAQMRGGTMPIGDLERRLADVENFTSGLRSEDETERRSFQDFAEKYGLMNKTPDEISEELAFARRVEIKGKPGAKRKIPPWRDMAEELDAMRVTVAKGASIAEAARQAATSSTKAVSENYWRSLERAFVQRRKFRQKNSG